MSTATTTPAGRMAALARAELTLLGRSRGTLFAALFVPLILPFSAREAVKQMDLAEAGLTVGTVILPASIGFSLLYAVYATLVSVYTARREELVLKRLRTGELRDREILAGAALPAVATGLAQSAVLTIGCVVLLDVGAPPAPHLAVLGLLLGIVVCVSLAAVTSSFTRSVESTQVTTLPVVFLSMIFSGMFIPLEVLPDRMASACELLPLTPAITLLRGAWTGELSAYEAMGPLMTGLAWTALGVFAVQRRFRWEPRR
ncbi:MAG: ABC transporter permease [Streptomyces sp.]|nr:ABC transporter permease [Streptomyces sp.]